MKKRRIEEIDLLRSIAIICVVIVHSISRVIEIYESHNMLLSYQKDILLTMRLFTTFGTPIFIFLSVFLLAYAYSDQLPDNFMKKRVKLILIPYISMALVYALIMIHENGFLHNGNALIKYIQYFIENIFTGFYRHGYFIIVIFQFYIIYKLFNKKLKKINAIKLLSSTFFINILYLMFFNFSDPEILPYGNHIWKGATWGTFPAWIFYFAVGYCSGKNINQLNKRLDKYKNLIFPSAIIFGGSLAYMYLSGRLSENSSKRFDMILFSTSMFLLIYYIGTKINNTPKFFKFISRYSFGIFLFHMIYLYLATYLFTEFFYIKLNPFSTLILLVISSTILSIFTTYFLDKTSHGSLLIGKLEKPKN